MRKFAGALLMTAAAYFGMAGNVYANMESGLFLFENKKKEVFMIATYIWVEDEGQAAEIAARIKYPLIKAVRQSLNEGLKEPAWERMSSSAHSNMKFLGDIRRSVEFSIFMDGCSLGKVCAEDRTDIVLFRHSGEKAVKFSEAREKTGRLLAMNDEDLHQWIQATARKIVELWNNKMKDTEKK